MQGADWAPRRLLLVSTLPTYRDPCIAEILLPNLWCLPKPDHDPPPRRKACTARRCRACHPSRLGAGTDASTAAGPFGAAPGARQTPDDGIFSTAAPRKPTGELWQP